jgi:hypothetical protein
MRTTGAAVLFTAMTVLAGIAYWIPGFVACVSTAKWPCSCACC